MTPVFARLCAVLRRFSLGEKSFTVVALGYIALIDLHGCPPSVYAAVWDTLSHSTGIKCLNYMRKRGPVIKSYRPPPERPRKRPIYKAFRGLNRNT